MGANIEPIIEVLKQNNTLKTLILKVWMSAKSKGIGIILNIIEQGQNTRSGTLLLKEQAALEQNGSLEVLHLTVSRN